jgi:hypothetical protein
MVYRNFVLVGQGQTLTASNGNEYVKYDVFYNDRPVCSGQIVWKNKNEKLNQAFNLFGAGGEVKTDGLIIQFDTGEQNQAGNTKRNIFISKKMVDALMQQGSTEEEAVAKAALMMDNRLRDRITTARILDLDIPSTITHQSVNELVGTLFGKGKPAQNAIPVKKIATVEDLSF